MKEGFDLGARVRGKTGTTIGTLVKSADPESWRKNLPHYSGEGFYFVKWESRDEIFVAHEDDLVLIGPKRAPLHKTTITVWSDDNPASLEDAVLDAAENIGTSLVYFGVEVIEDPAADPDWDEHLEETFNAPEEPQPEDEEPQECPACGGPSGLMGTLGNTKHYNCRNCGAWSS